MEKLGAYKVPYSNSLAIAKGEKGEGRNGLQSDFATVVDSFINEANNKGVIITTGTYGYMSPRSIKDYAEKGMTQYKGAYTHFIHGLALEITSIDTTNDTDGWWSNGFDSALDEAGLSIRKQTISDSTNIAGKLKSTGAIIKKATRITGGGNSQAYIFVPRNFDDKDENTEKVTYDSTAVSGNADGTSSSSAAGTTTSGPSASFAEGSYFFTNMFQAIREQGLSELLKGDRALANDVPLWNSVKSAINTSMRSCMSAPDGSFIAWYPDYWGLVDNTPVLEIEDVELIDLTITHSDATFYSHVFAPGVTTSGAKPSDGMDYILTQGVVSIESGMAAATSETVFNEEGVSIAATEPSALLSNIIYIPEGEGWKYSPAELYRRYGARPMKVSDGSQFAGTAKLIEEFSGNEFDESFESNPKYIMPFLNALYEFMRLWSGQYRANIAITFMPELFPGNRIKVKSLDISFYVESVTHNMSYTSGFTTDITASCPIGTLLPGMVNPNMDVPENTSTNNKRNYSYSTGDVIG